MFAIGDAEWPGISKLVEEMGEVNQIIGKLMATHGSVKHWDSEVSLRDRLQEELADLQAALMFVMVVNAFDMEAIDARASEKMRLFAQWHDEGLSDAAV